MLPKKPKELPTDVMLGACIIVGILFMIPLLLIKGISEINFTIDVIVAIFYVASFASLGGFLCWSYGVAGLGPERAGQFIHLMPFFGTILAILILGERPEWHHLIGAIIIMAGILVANKK